MSHDSGVCHRWDPGGRHQPLRRLSRQTGSLRSRQLQQDPFPLFKCAQTVPLCHYQIGHTYFTQEMKVFLLLVTSAYLCLVKMTSETWPGESDYHQSIHTLAHHVITCLCGCGPNFVLHEEGGSKDFSVCLHACICQKTSVRPYGLTGMLTLQRSSRTDQCQGSKCQTQLTGPFHFHHVTFRWRRRLPFVRPYTHRWIFSLSS